MSLASSTKRILLTVPIEPVPLARPRFSRGRAYLPKRSQDFRQAIQEVASIAMDSLEPFTDALFCRLAFYRKFKPTARNFGDCDNLVKAIFDALNGICYRDDAQIVDVRAIKRQDKDEPRVVIDIGCIGFEKKSPQRVITPFEEGIDEQ